MYSSGWAAAVKDELPFSQVGDQKLQMTVSLYPKVNYEQESGVVPYIARTKKEVNLTMLEDEVDLFLGRRNQIFSSFPQLFVFVDPI